MDKAPRPLSLLLKALLIGFAVYGVADAFVEYAAGTGLQAFPLRYFTIQSNILVACVTVYFLAGEARWTVPDLGLRVFLRGATLLAI